jgi:hypothetical protein
MIELSEIEDKLVTKTGKPIRIRWPKGVFRFKRGDYVWVRDVSKSGHGYKIEQARVRERHYHPDRNPFYPNGEGYSLDGELWWGCYPGCRVFKTREEDLSARMGDLR